MKENKLNTKYIVKAGLIAAVYVVLILIQIPMGSLAFGQVQLRLSESLTLLPLVEPAAVPGLFVGCLISNLLLSSFSMFGLADIVGGSLVTLLAAYLTSKSKSRWTGSLPPIILNGLIVSIWVSYFTNAPYKITAALIMAGEAVSVLVFGNIVLSIYLKALKNKDL